jgi:DNA-binding transcriptional LysR family regulator
LTEKGKFHWVALLPVTSNFASWELLRDEFVALLPPQVEMPEPNQPLTWESLTRHPMIMHPTAAHTRRMQKHFAQFGYQLHLAFLNVLCGVCQSSFYLQKK